MRQLRLPPLRRLWRLASTPLALVLLAPDAGLIERIGSRQHRANVRFEASEILVWRHVDVDAVQLAEGTGSLLRIGDVQNGEFGVLGVDDIGYGELVAAVIDLKRQVRTGLNSQ